MKRSSEPSDSTFAPIISICIKLIILVCLTGCGNRSQQDNREISIKEKDRLAVLQLLLADEDVIKFYHPEEQGRDTLKVYGTGLSAGHLLTFLPEPVITCTIEMCEKCMVISRLDILADSAYATYEYEVEGLFGYFVFKKQPTGWVVADSYVAEH